MKNQNESTHLINEATHRVIICMLCAGITAKLFSFFNREMAAFTGNLGDTAGAVFVLLLYAAAFVCMLLSRKRDLALTGIILFFTSLLYESFPFFSGLRHTEQKFSRFTGVLYAQGIFCIVMLIILVLFAARVITSKTVVMLAVSVTALFVIMVNVATSATTESYSDYLLGLNDWSLTLARSFFLVACSVFLEFGEFFRPEKAARAVLAAE